MLALPEVHLFILLKLFSVCEGTSPLFFVLNVFQTFVHIFVLGVTRYDSGYVCQASWTSNQGCSILTLLRFWLWLVYTDFFPLLCYLLIKGYHLIAKFVCLFSAVLQLYALPDAFASLCQFLSIRGWQLLNQNRMPISTFKDLWNRIEGQLHRCLCVYRQLFLLFLRCRWHFTKSQCVKLFTQWTWRAAAFAQHFVNDCLVLTYQLHCLVILIHDVCHLRWERAIRIKWSPQGPIFNGNTNFLLGLLQNHVLKRQCL